MKKVLVTGSSGYIGSHLCAKLLKAGYHVVGIDKNYPTDEFDAFLIQNPEYTFSFANQNINAPFDSSDEYNAVIHLAALVNVGESEKTPIQYYITNINGTMNCLAKIKTDNFIFASTGAAEGCESAYGIRKRAAEDCVVEYCTQHKQRDYTIFRFYNVIGSAGFKATNPDGLMYNLNKAIDTKEFTIFGNDYDTVDGTCIRDYVHVLEICEALQTAIEKPANGTESLGHGVGRSVKEIVDMFKKINDVDFEVKYGPRRKGDLESSVLSNVSSYMKSLYDLETLLKL
jgi:UDP-glucose 4-epimerase